MEAARVAILLLLISIIDIQYLSAGTVVDQFCRTKSDGNYLCTDAARQNAVCGCRKGKSCVDEEWYDPLTDTCSSDSVLVKRLIDCMNPEGDFFNAPPPAQDAGFCDEKDDGNYPCRSGSTDVCSCYNKDMCADGEWYDSILDKCTKLTNEVLAKLTKCLGEPSEKTPPIEPETTTTITDVIDKCPGDFEGPSEGGFCYKAIVDVMTWNVAKEKCKEYHPDAHPAYVQTAEENKAIVDLLKPYRNAAPACDVAGAKVENYWIGGQRKNVNECKLPENQRTHEFLWTIDATHTALVSDYTNWLAGEPNCSKNRVENCMAYRCGDYDLDNCQWLDYVCQSIACLVCQIKL